MRKYVVGLLIGLACAAAGWGFARWQFQQGTLIPVPAAIPPGATPSPTTGMGVKLDPAAPGSVEVTPVVAESLNVQLGNLVVAPETESLSLTGSLFIDSDRLAYVHSRFTGEMVDLGTVTDRTETADPAGEREQRHLRAGDRVKAGQMLAVIWSREIGEKKSDLVDALSRVHSSQARLERLDKLEKGTVSEQVMREARRQFEADEIAVERAERTLRSWRETDEEIKEVYREAERVRNREARPQDGGLDRTWANVEIRAPFDGTILERNVSLGEIVESTEVLFTIANLDRMGVLANAYEEDVPKLVAMRPEDRSWEISLKAEPDAPSFKGRFEVVGNVIDPGQHTAAVIGWIENPEHRLRVGQFITARIKVPVQEGLIAIPNAALIDEGTAAYVFSVIGHDPLRVDLRQVDVFRRTREFALVRRSTAVEAGKSALKEGDAVVVSGNLELFGALQDQRAAGEKPAAASTNAPEQTAEQPAS